MKVLFFYIGVESLGIEHLAAAARKAGHQVELAFDPSVFGGHLMWDFPSLAKMFDKRAAVLKKVADTKPDIAAFSCVSANYQWSLGLARDIKRAHPGIVSMFGGTHVTAVPERVIAEDAVDVAIVSEGDVSFPLAIADAGSGNREARPGVLKKSGGEIIRGPAPEPVEDLDALPFPAKDLFYSKAPALERHYTIMASRGCPFKCTYCHNSYSSSLSGGQRMRDRSVDNIVAELEPVAARGRARLVKFYDDVFGFNKKWLEEFAEKYPSRVGLPFYCSLHPRTANKETADRLKESGCRYVAIGIQSVDEGQRKNVLKRIYTNDDARRSVALLKERGIRVLLDHIIGLPGDTEEMMEDAARFYNELRPTRLLVFWLSYFPGTEILAAASASGLLSEAEVESINAGMEGSFYAGHGGRRISMFMRFIAFFSMIPLLPRGAVDFMIRKKLYRRMPPSSTMSKIAVALNALITRDAFFIYNVRYLLSRKKTP
ncbi:MAG TPA: radical SAM protein [bacterium]|nr:radical SAM protein [bacterium]